ncbi:E3 ubiquitin-protein ligase RNF19A-like [Poecilia reticulata]|uniref:E3 ubiquitin-protein ligase RNF19A-like n=1 Tax=Poecilia reticulata TaxID=8081 RepID=UPI0004A4039D|nr:PREDICTED: E3 ubiquitin-protein ligase RNF19A-like [Poecilia reticulata]
MSIDPSPYAALDRSLLRKKMGSSASKEKCYDPKDSTLKFVDGDDDMDFLCEGFKSRRAQMSCGHTVTPMSLTKWCLQQLEEGKSKFSCGVCKAAWPYEEVCKMALLTPEEMKNLKKMMKINGAVSRKCPGCKSSVVKQDELNLCVGCTACTKKRGRPYEFCWQCQRKWKGPKPRSDRCENDGCSNTALQTLRICPEIVFDTVWGISGCPSIRACPTCGSLLEHKRNHCKHLYCARCEVKFCFVCLKTFAECSKTSQISGPCSSGVAPRQTEIPVWRKT